MKNILSTTGQFAKGLGQSSEYVKNFSAELTRAAADYAAFQGKTAAADVNEYARKFAKATLGEVGELKDIGIVVDTTTKQFQNAVQEMMELTGTTEAQAKQMVIQKELLQQVDIAAGAASKNMYDGWSQLNKLFDQFKEILGGVGEIFSTVFGPVLSTLNAVLEIPFVKSTAAWVIAVAGVAYGYTALLKTLSLIRTTMIGTAEAQKLSAELQIRAVQANAKVLAIKKDELKIQERIADIQSKLLENEANMRSKGLKLSNRKDPLGKERSSLMSQKTFANNALTKYQEDAEEALKAIGAEFKDLGASTTEALAGLAGLDPAFIGLVQSVNGITDATKGLTIAQISSKAATLGAAAAEKILAFTRASGSKKNLLGGALSSITGFFSGFFKTLAGGATGLAAVKAAATTMGIALVKLAGILAAVIVVLDGIKIVANLISGKEWNAGTITRWFAEWIYGLDELEKRSQELDEENRRIFGNIAKVKELRQELEDAKLDRAISQMLPDDAIAALQKKNHSTREEIETLTWIVANFGDAVKRGMVEIPEGKTNDEVRVETQQKLNNLTKELWNSEDKLAEKTKQLASLNWKFFDELDKLNDVWDRLKETFSYGYKKGKFQDLSKDYKYQQDANRIGDLNRYLRQLGGATDLNSLERSKKYLTEIFSLTRDRFKYEVDQLMAQRDAMINNLKAMANIVKQAAGFRSSAQASVEANSMEALELTSRRLEGLRSSELSPMIEQQKQVKEIERQVLVKQNQAVTVLEKINNQLYGVVNKIGTGSGASREVINAVNPL